MNMPVSKKKCKINIEDISFDRIHLSCILQYFGIHRYHHHHIKSRKTVYWSPATVIWATDKVHILAVSTRGAHADIVYMYDIHSTQYQRRETRHSATGHATEITSLISPAHIYGRRDFALLESFTVFAL